MWSLAALNEQFYNEKQTKKGYNKIEVLNSNSFLKELSFGMIVLGIGLIGLLKAAIEMFENHRLDKKG